MVICSASLVTEFKKIDSERITPQDLIPQMKVDCEVELNAFDERLIRLLKLMGPFGPLNLRPVFVSRNLTVVGNPTIVGNNHLKMSFLKFEIENGGSCNV